MVKLIKICPKCKSQNIKPDLSVQAYGQGSFFNHFKCNDCGYTGQFFPEVLKNK
ncbi:hypothetical protein ACFLZB_03610 [Nanoarchaeota archaeon]